MTGSIEAVKEFRAHQGEIKSVSVSQDGRNYATAGADKSIKIFDVVTFGELRRHSSYTGKLAEKDRPIGDYHAPVNAEFHMLYA